jgi:DNA primase
VKIAELRQRFSISEAWQALGLQGRPGSCVSSPFRKDAHPSFSLWRAHDGVARFKDHATGESGDVIDFLKLARHCDTAEAIQFIERQLGVVRPERTAQPKPTPKIPPLRPGAEAERRELCERRGFSVEGLRLAEHRGLLFFAELWGHAAWAVTDRRRQLVEFRRLDGAKWPAYGRLSERKSHAYGSKRWPLGVLESEPFPRIALVEGAPDLLAACTLIIAEDKVALVAPVAVLGASNHNLDQAALVHFKGKRVCIYPHCDDAGRKAARAWARVLKAAGAERVTAFDLSGLVLVDGTEGKDLADLCRIDAACWERERKFREVLL